MYLFQSKVPMKELNQTMDRLEAIIVQLGGRELEKKKINYSDYFELKKHIYDGLAYLNNLEELIQSKKDDKINEIKYRSTKRTILSNLTEDIKKLAYLYNKKQKHDETIREDGLITIEDLTSSIKKLKGIDIEKYIDKPESLNSFVNRDRDIGIGTGIKTKREDLTVENKESLQQISIQVEEQDVLLTEISEGCDVLLKIANEMNDELQIQDKILTDLNNKTEKIEGKLDKTNNRMKDTLKILNPSNTSKFCCYFILIILLIIVAVILYKFITTGKIN
jgi:t-SNARE complex subunit (syntaxin)